MYKLFILSFLFVFSLNNLFCKVNEKKDSICFYIEKNKSLTKEELIKKKNNCYGKEKIASQYLLGKKYYESNEFEKAIEYFDLVLSESKFLVKDNFRYKTTLNKALCLKELGNFERAIVNISMTYSYYINTEDSLEKAKLQYDIADIYFVWGKNDFAGEYFRKAEFLFKKNNQTELLAKTYQKLGAIAGKMNLHTLAIDYYKKCEAISRKHQYSISLVNSLVNLGNESIALNKYDQAAFYLKEALSLSKNKHYIKGQIFSLNYIAQLYVMKNDNSNALELLKQSKQLLNNELDKETEILIFNNIATVYKLMGNYKQALYFFKKINRVQIEEKQQQTLTFLNIGEIYKLQQKYTNAQRYLDSCIIIALNTNNLDIKFKAEFELSEVYFKQNKIKETKFLLLSLLENINQINDIYLESGIYLRISDFYRNQDNTNKAIEYYEKYHNLQIEILEKTYNLQIGKIQNETKLNQIEEELTKKNRENKKKKEQITFQNKILLVLIISGFTHIILSFFLYKNYKQKKEAFNDLKNRNRELAKQIPFDTEKKIIEKHISKNDKKKHAELISKLITLFESQELYLENNITLSKTAKELNTNRTYLSEAIQEIFNMNFNTLVNKYRIEKARKMLMQQNNLTIEGIAQTVGFNSKSSFNMAFKKNTGLTPSEFRCQGNCE